MDKTFLKMKWTNEENKKFSYVGDFGWYAKAID